MANKAAFIGLGVMGYPMAGHLASAGHSVSVYNRTKAKAEQWQKEHKGTAFGTPREAAAGADIVMICVCLLYTSPSPRDGLLSRMPSSA